MSLHDLLGEYDRALSYTEDLWQGLTVEEIHWRPSSNSSAIGWHLGHQPAVAHFMVRNLTAAEPGIDPDLDRLMDPKPTEVTPRSPTSSQRSRATSCSARRGDNRYYLLMLHRGERPWREQGRSDSSDVRYRDPLQVVADRDRL